MSFTILMITENYIQFPLLPAETIHRLEYPLLYELRRKVSVIATTKTILWVTIPGVQQCPDYSLGR